MKKSVILLIPIILLASCSDVLDKYPLDKPSQETFYTNAAEISSGVVACYRFLRETDEGAYTFPIVLDCMADVAFPRQDNNYKTIARGEHDDKNTAIRDTWSRAYQGVGRCNTILQVLEEKASLLTDDQIRQYRGEALFLRAYYYARLVLYFGDVPLVLQPITAVSEAMEITRTPKDQVITQIMADYTEAASLLPLQYTAAAEIGRATQGMANAYKARAALYFGQWSVAAEAANAVIQSGIYQLYPQYGNLFLPAGLWDASNKEIILTQEFGGAINSYHALPQYLLSRNVVGWACLVPSQSMLDSYLCTDGKNIAESPLFDKSAPFENRDPRLKLSFVTPGDRFGDFRFDSHVDSTSCYNYVTDAWVTNNDCYTINQYTSYTGYYARKYADMDYKNRLGQGDYPIILCRYAEVLLTYAEAKIELNQIDQSVVDALNQLRTSREDVQMIPFSLSDLSDQQQARLKVRLERKVELAFEGFRYADIRRWGWAERYANRPILGRPFKGSFSDWPNVSFDENGEPEYKGYESYEPHPSTDYRIVENRMFTKNRDELWPIPERERNLNPNLVQNPGY
ncbi:MAG: RagB/SusD family nutrient uptake outer membrane protein [Tannerellaceae bacterium]|jgi:hypothetical protein|nr:RagB/SusD family nutrient uptake outer membrane protein [Tannerellaceae bacterium]